MMSQAQSQSFFQSQSMTQSQSRQSDISDPVEKEKKVNDLVQYLLVMDQKKLPVKKKDINRVVLKGHSRVFVAVMEETARKLLEVYGFKVVELQDKMKDCFILVNNVEFSISQHKLIKRSEREKAEMGLVSVILGMIFMNGNSIHEVELWHALKKLGIYEEEVHSTFGNVKQLIVREFVRRGYLQTELNHSTEPATLDLSWGQRAVHEVSKQDMLELVCSINETQPSDWLKQMKEITDQQSQQSQPQSTQPVPGPSSTRSR